MNICQKNWFGQSCHFEKTMLIWKDANTAFRII